MIKINESNPIKLTRRKVKRNNNKNGINKVKDMENRNSQKLDKIIKDLNFMEITNRVVKPTKKSKQAVRNRRKINKLPITMNALHKMTKGMYSSYEKALLYPEYALDAKIPGAFPLPTLAYHKKFTLTVPTGASGVGTGLLSWCINPITWGVSTANASTFWFNNDPTQDLITAGYNKWQAAPILSSLGIPASTFTAARLVSASMVVTPIVSINTAEGFVAGCVTTRGAIAPDAQTSGFPTGTGSNTVFGNNNVMAAVDSGMYYQSQQISINNSLRFIYVPFDPSFNQFIGTGGSRYAMFGDYSDDFYWYGYINGTAASTNVNFEFYLNFELEPDVEVFVQALACPCSSSEKTEKVLEQISKNSELVSQGGLNLMSKVQDDHEQYTNTGIPSLFNSITKGADWLNSHSSLFDTLASLGGTANKFLPLL